MPELRQIFLSQSLENLSKLRAQFGVADTTLWIRDFFRAVHTIKGGAQTFGLKNQAHLAAEIENLINVTPDPMILAAELENLAVCLAEKTPVEISSSIDRNQDVSGAKIVITSLMQTHFEMLASSEKDAFAKAACDGRTLYLIRVALKPAELGVFFRGLAVQSEVIASIPEETPDRSVSTFSIIAAAESPLEFPAQKVSIGQIDVERPLTSNLAKVFIQLAAHVEQICKDAGKAIKVNFFAGETTRRDLPDKVFPILLHLVRNAADHGIQEAGTIEISWFEDEHSWLLSVSDDGRGIDISVVRARAIALELISADDPIDDAAILNQVFAHGFSTAARVTEISGRGLGLDVVQTSVHALNGKISVKNRKNKGTIFAVVLPKENL